jgi:CheY-like chemotaxis protein/HPt (histidine-containing phosphotransfer) domain-containing protein
VTIAGNGHEGVDALRHNDFDVVLMDIQMPELDGVQATRQIRELPPPTNAVHIIAMTAHAMAGAKEEYLAAGMNDYISKPVDVHLLLDKLSKIAKPTITATEEVKEARVSKEPPPEASAPIFDQIKLSELASILPMNKVEEFIKTYFLDSEINLIRIGEELARNDCAAAGRVAHEMVSICGNFGAMRASKLARQLQTDCREGNRSACYESVRDLSNAVNAASAEIHAWLLEALRVKPMPEVA